MGFLLKDYLSLVLLFWGIIYTVLRWKRKGKEINRESEEIPTWQWIPIKLPLLNGILTFLKMRKDGLAVADQISRASSSKIVKVPIGPTSIYLLWDADIIQTMLKSTSDVDYVDKPKRFYDIVLPSYLNDGLIACSLDVWTRHRKAVSLAFTYKSILMYLQYANGCAKDMMDTILSEVNGKSINHKQIKGHLDHFILKLVTQVILGSECSAFSNEELAQFFEDFRTAKDVTVERMLSPFLLLPPVWFLHPKRQKLNSAAESIFKFSIKIINRYREKTVNNSNQDKKKESKYLPSISETVTSVQSQEATDTESSTTKVDEDNQIGAKPFGCLVEQLISSGLPPQEICNEVITFLAAGHETVLVALDMLIFQLALHPSYQKLCQQEVDLMFDSHADKHGPTEENFTMDEVSSLKYLERCILESLRLTPTVPFIGRLIRAPLKISPSITLNAGETVAICPWAVHRHPDYYPNPEVYDPDRFLTENVKQRHQYSFLPFSLGSRNCVGYKVAMTEIKVFMSYILRHFDLSTTDGPNDVKIFFDVTIRPERTYNVIYTKRNI